MSRTIRKFQEMQKELDVVIHKKHKLGNVYVDEKINSNTIIACLVEIGELANEIAFFKHWKIDKQIDKIKLLDEFADVMHFIFALNNIDRLQPKIASTLEEIYDKTFITNNFDNLFFKMYKEVVNYQSGVALVTLITIGKSLEFTYQEIESAYDEKHAINYLRQESGY